MYFVEEGAVGELFNPRTEAYWLKASKAGTDVFAVSLVL